MEVEIGRGKKGRRAYGFDDIAIVPSRRTRDPDDIDITWTLGPYRFELPLLASAMDGVVSPRHRGRRSASSAGWPCSTSRASGPATRTPDAQLERIAGFPKERGHRRDAAHLPGADQAGARSPSASARSRSRASSRAASLTPAARARALRDWRSRPGLDILVIQGTVISAEHVSTDAASRSTSRSSSARCRSRSWSAAAPPTPPACT